MSTSQIINDEIIKFVATRMDDAVLNPKDCYFPFEVVADAYEKGVESGQRSYKEELREQYYSKAKLSIDATSAFLRKLNEKDYEVQKLFLNHNFNNTVVMFSVNEDIHGSDEFIDFAYAEATSISNEFREKGLEIEIMFIDESDNINYNLIKSDGFLFIYDLAKQARI